MKKAILVTFALLLVLPLINADLNVLLQQGNDQRNSYNPLGTGTDDYTQIFAPGSASGTYTSPVVFDANGDEIQEIFLYGGNDIINILNGANPSFEQASVTLGEPFISPVACDIDNDGFLEYVGVFNNASADFLTFLDFSAEGIATQGPVSVQANQTSIFGKMVCNRFFFEENGDPSNYVMFVDTEKFLHYAKIVGGVWDETIVDSDGSVLHEDGDEYAFGDNDVSIIENGGNGKKVIQWISGTFIHGFTPDLQGFSDDFSGELVGFPSFNDRVFSGVRTSPFGIDKVFVASSAIGSGTTTKTTIILYKITTLVGDFSWGIDSSVQPDWGGSGFRNNQIAMAIGAYQDDGTQDLYMRQEWEQEQDQTDGTQVRIFSGLDLSLLNSSTTDALCDTEPNRGFPNRMWLIDMDNDGDKDILTMCNGAVSTERMIYYLRAPDFNQNQTIFQDSTVTDKMTPVPVDYNRDGEMDFIFSTPAFTYLLQSSVATSTQQNFPFTATFKNVSGLVATTNITALFENPTAFFNFASVCSITEESIWTETFTTGYNFTERNVSLNIVPPEDFLTPAGIQVGLGGNITTFNLLKEHPIGVRETMRLRVSYASSANSIVDLFALADDSRFTEFWRLNKTGLGLTIQQVVPFQGIINVGTTSLNSSFITFDVIHTPTFDAFNDIQSYDIDLFVNGVLVNGTTSTAVFEGENIRNVQLFTQSPSNFTFIQLSLSTVSDVEPIFSQFQNGIRTTVNDVTLTVPSIVGPVVSGDGFDIITDFNNQFFSRCTYENPGVFTQRHYIAPINTAGDYSNFRELIVTIPGPEDDVEFGDPGSFEEDPLISGLFDLLPDILQGPLGRLIIWLVFSALIVVTGFIISEALGLVAVALALVIGVLTGALPLWMGVVLVVVTAGVIALAMRKIFAGGG